MEHGSRSAQSRPQDAFKELIPLMQDRTVVSMVGGAPTPSLFPITGIKLQLADGREVSVEGVDCNSAQRYAPFAQGPLLAWCRQQVELLHNPPAEWEVSISAGSMSSIDICTDNLFDEGDTILVEEFTFTAALDAFQAKQLNIERIALDSGGLVPEALEQKCLELQRRSVQPRALFIIPVGQNPTGSRLRDERYPAIYDIASKYDFVIIEDDPYFYLQYPARPQRGPAALPGLALGRTFLSLDTQGRVLRLDSFSKLLAPGFRLGWVTGPPRLMGHFRQHCYTSSQWGASLSMKVLAALFQAWGDQGLRDVVLATQENYMVRRDRAVSAAERHLSSVATWSSPAAGFFLWVCLNTPLDASKLLAKMRRHKVLVLADAFCCAERSAQTKYVRVSFNHDDLQQIDDGIERLGKLVMEEMEDEATSQ